MWRQKEKKRRNNQSMRRKSREVGAGRKGNSEREDYKEVEKRLVKGNENFLSLHSSGSYPEHLKECPAFQ